MTLRTRVLLLALAALVVIGLLSAQLVDRYTESRDRFAEVSQVLAPAVTAAAQLTADVTTMDRRLRMYVFSGEERFRSLYQTAQRRADNHLARVDDLVEDLQEYDDALTDTHQALDRWRAQVGDPVFAAMADKDPALAQAIMDSDTAQIAYGRLTSETTSLSTLLSRDQDDALDVAAQATRRLAAALILALVVLLLLPVANYLAIRGSVLRPIADLRAQLRRTATPGHHDTVIHANGPPEVAELGRDAEALRRALVVEIDQSTAARRALEQESPVVEAIRKELAAQTGEGVAGVTIQGLMRPAEGVLAGDFWDRVPLGDGRAAVIVCDISGHGARAGIVAMRLKTTISLGLRAGQDLPQILHRACDGFADEPARFATVVIIVADPRTRTLEWVNAGHPAARIVRSDGTIELLGPTGPMVSWLIGSWTMARTQLGPDDVCLAFTDGILESRDSAGDELGDDGMDEHLRQAALGTRDPAEVTTRLVASVRQRAADIGRDDLTVVGLAWGPLPTPAASGSSSGSKPPST
jgi:serine phosphatase RsbU (regulator of sigma subunit)/CHASE3 domain sensor protein